jgi:twitching motility protein PilT
VNQSVSMRDLLVAMAEKNASDLHITAGAAPTLRVHGHLVALDYPPLDGEQTKALAYSLINAEQRERFESNHELDFSYGVTGLSRYRVNVYRQRGAVGVALRSIPHQPKSFQELGLPAEICTQLIQKHKGLILVTGPTGHGKTTSMAAMLDRINRERDVHIVTVEDPLEYLYQHQKAIVNQREVGSDTHSFPAALKYVLRQDPDVVLIGEMRDLETIQAALTIAETGHITFATLHTNSCAQSIDRIIDVFPPHQQSQVRAQLALVLEAVFNQLLVPRRDGRGRALAMEILIATPAIRNMIREEKVHQIYSAMQAGQEKLGMQTMNQSLATLYQRRLITLETALGASSLKDELEQMITRGTGVVPGAGLNRAGTAIRR